MEWSWDYFWMFWLFVIIFAVLWVIVTLLRKRREEKITPYTKLLKPYIEKALIKGYEKEVIRTELIKRNWPEGIVNDVLKEVKNA
ncbi:MAG: hypothetical protein ABIE22_04065 [archaeon]